MADGEDRFDARAALRRMVEQEARREQSRHQAEAAQARRDQADEQARAAAVGDREREAREIVAAFLDAMRQARNRGTERYRRVDWGKIPWWNLVQRMEQGTEGLIPGPMLDGWVLVERGAYLDGDDRRTDFGGPPTGPGLLVSTAGDFYTIGGSPPRERWAQPVKLEHCVTTILELPFLARCLRRNGVTP